MEKENIISFSSRYNQVYYKLKNLDISDENYIFEQAKNNELTVALYNSSKKIYLHSAYNPSSESEKIIQQVYTPETDIVFLIGGGLGYPLRNLYEHLEPEQKIIFIETDLYLLKKSFEIHDYSFIFKDKRFHFIYFEGENIFKAKLLALLMDIFPHSDSVKMEYMDFYKRCDYKRDETQKIYKILAEVTSSVAMARKEVYGKIDELRLNGLAKKFLGEYEECLEKMKELIIDEDRKLSEAEIGLLATYFLFSHYSYQENFDKGSIECK